MLWALVGLAACTVSATAQEVAIHSFDRDGTLTYNEITNAAAYGIEWAPQLDGEWTGFGRTDLEFIPPGGGEGSITSAIPVRYRVVANVHTDYLVVDLSGGPSATNYPISSYTDVPPGGWTDEYKTTKMVFRLIPAGTYVRGSPTNEPTRFSDERQHTVIITRPFYIGVFEVTQTQWERVMGTWPSYFSNVTYRATRPVEWVSYEAIVGVGWWWPDTSEVSPESFMGRLSTRTGMMVHLPTEGEWEYAARAGSTAALTSGLNVTNDLVDDNLGAIARYRANSDYANVHRNSDLSQGTTTVGTYPPNNWGLYDIHGNVSELLSDTQGPYPDLGATVVDPRGVSFNSDSYFFKLNRGGSYFSTVSNSRLAYRMFSLNPSAGEGVRAVIRPYTDHLP